MSENKETRGRPTNAERLGKYRSNSVSTLDELLKRKREREVPGETGEKDKEEEMEAIRKSRIIERSPKKEENMMEEFMKRMEERLEKMIEESTKQIIERMREEYKEEMIKWGEEMRKEREEWRAEKKELEGKIREQEERITKLERVEEKMEREKRKLNVIIKGTEWKERVGEKEVENFLAKELKVDVKVNKAIRIGRGKEKEMILAELRSWEEKREVMQRKKTLKTGIYIDDDLTKEERLVQEKLRERARDERIKGRTAKVGYRRMIIGEKKFVWDDKRQDIIEKRGGRR
ncbi:trichohyalin-like [Ceratina calcarata]|uniref:Trichohyalin-like n=1 Tax=Ceratina calcarata TaxID=156304 RepID=A0AAJ7SAE6_9HYME|nr:trichohyalin-like [Ceratina calcarata]